MVIQHLTKRENNLRDDSLQAVQSFSVFVEATVKATVRNNHLGQIELERVIDNQ